MDGVFLWDHVTCNPAWGGTPSMADPWLCLAAAATATSRVLLGTLVTPLPRRRPQIVARQVVTLGHLSGGRAVLGVGIGEDFEYEAYGEPVRARGARLDEGLEIVTRLLTGDETDFEGDHYAVHSPPSLPRPVRGTIPIWVGGHWPNQPPFARASRYDGVVPRKIGGDLDTADLHAIRELVGRNGGFDYVASGSTASPQDTDGVRAWDAAGATWWLELLHPFGGRAAAMRDRLRAGPPEL